MDVFDGLADPVRRALLTRLVAGPARVVDLAAAHAISRPAVSKHLRVLADVGLVAADSCGRERHYRLEPGALGPVREFLDVLGRPRTGVPPLISETALDALDTEVRRTSRERDRALATIDAPPSTETRHQESA